MLKIYNYEGGLETVMMDEASLKTSGLTCPNCGSGKIKIIRGEISSTGSVQECSCCICQHGFIVSTCLTKKKQDDESMQDEVVMDAMKALLTRRSIRRFKSDKIKNSDIRDILEAGMNAPSAGNEQPWHFIVIDDPFILKEIPSFHKHAEMLKEAPLAILVCGDMDLVKHGDMWIQDCSAATENILLAIHSKHLGGVWLGVYPREDRVNGLKNLLKLPDNIVPFSLVAAGYPAERKTYKSRYDESRVHYNKW